MPDVRRLLAAHKPGDARSLQALGVALAATVVDPPDLPDDGAARLDAVETRGAELPGTWQQVRAARDYGQITDAEYEYLAAAVEALTEEDT